MIYKVLRTGKSNETGLFGVDDCTTEIKKGIETSNEEQQNEYRVQLKAHLKNMREAIKADKTVEITDCTDDCKHGYIPPKVISTIDELDEYEESLKYYLT